MTTQKHCLKILIILITALVSLLAAKTHALVVLQYHHIADDTPPATSTLPAKFAEHLAYLKKEGFKVIDLQTAINAINNQELPLPKTVLITFDDGSSTIHDTALPLLKKYDYPFVVFINTDAVEQKNIRTLSWQQIKELKKHGAAIANHSTSHTHMVRRQTNEGEQAWLSRMREEITQAQKLIKHHTGDDHPVFAYPFGEYNNLLKALIQELGYIAFGQHSGPLGNFDKQALPRFPMGGDHGKIDSFKLKINTEPFDVFTYQFVEGKRTEVFDSALSLKQPQPLMAITVKNADQLDAINCFLSPGNKTQKKIISETTAHFQAETPHPSGRSRFNCTAPTGKGNYYWHSIPFIRRNSDGSWVKE